MDFPIYRWLNDFRILFDCNFECVTIYLRHQDAEETPLNNNTKQQVLFSSFLGMTTRIWSSIPDH